MICLKAMATPPFVAEGGCTQESGAIFWQTSTGMCRSVWTFTGAWATATSMGEVGVGVG